MRLVASSPVATGVSRSLVTRFFSWTEGKCMKTRSLFPCLCRSILLSAAALLTVCFAPVAQAQDACSTVAIIGYPTPPVAVLLGETYTLSVSETSPAPLTPVSVQLYSCAGSETTPNGNWVIKGTANGGSHTWNCSNSAYGYYWWQGRGYDSYQPVADRIPFFSNAYGPYTTYGTDPIGGTGGPFKG